MVVATPQMLYKTCSKIQGNLTVAGVDEGATTNMVKPDNVKMLQNVGKKF